MTTSGACPRGPSRPRSSRPRSAALPRRRTRSAAAGPSRLPARSGGGKRRPFLFSGAPCSRGRGLPTQESLRSPSRRRGEQASSLSPNRGGSSGAGRRAVSPEGREGGDVRAPARGGTPAGRRPCPRRCAAGRRRARSPRSLPSLGQDGEDVPVCRLEDRGRARVGRVAIRASEPMWGATSPARAGSRERGARGRGAPRGRRSRARPRGARSPRGDGHRVPVVPAARDARAGRVDGEDAPEVAGGPDEGAQASRGTCPSSRRGRGAGVPPSALATVLGRFRTTSSSRPVTTRASRPVAATSVAWRSSDASTRTRPPARSPRARRGGGDRRARRDEDLVGARAE